jgi:uncharacterized membrane protein
MAAHPVVMEPVLDRRCLKDMQAMTVIPAHRPGVASHHPVVNRLNAERAKDVQLRLADRITAFVGSMPFVYLHVVMFGVWMILLEQSPWPKLTLMVSLEAIFLTCFVMIGQNHQSAFQQAKADHEYLEGEQELKLNTELTREIHELTREVHERVVVNASTTSEGRAPMDQPRTTTSQSTEGTEQRDGLPETA